MNSSQIDMIDHALLLLNRPDWSYKIDQKGGEQIPLSHLIAVEKLFWAVYGRPLDKDTSGVHWLAKAALLQAIAHTGYFVEPAGFWLKVFYLHTIAASIAMWWYILKGH